MTKRKTNTRKKITKNTPARAAYKERVFESDGEYLLKLILVVLLGTFWVKFGTTVTWLSLPISALPVGLLIGLIFISYFERFQSDRKIWYAVLVVVGIISYFVPAGIVV